jgi:HEAT repeat protein
MVAKESLSEDLVGVMQRFLDHSYICKATKDRRQRNLPMSLEVKEVVEVQNGPKWVEYIKARERVMAAVSSNGKATELSPDVLTATLDNAQVRSMLGTAEVHANEHWLFHGTSSQAVQGITNHDFRMDLAGSNRGTLYGRGFYMAECSSKADEYAEANEEGLCAMLLCRASLGRIHVNAERQPDSETLRSKVMAEYDSLCGDRWKAVGTFREFVVYNSAQVYPAYIIYYRRTTQRELLGRVRTVAEEKDLEQAALLIPQVAKLARIHPDEDVRYRISVVLNANDTIVVPALCTALKTEDRLVKQTAAEALNQIAQSTVSVALQHSDSNSDPNPMIVSAMPDLIDGLGDERECPGVRRALADTIGHLCKYAKPAMYPLIRCLSDSDDGIRAAAAGALGQIPTAAVAALTALIACLSDENGSVVAAAAASLGRFGQAAAAALPALVHCLTANDDSVRQHAAVAVGAVGQPDVVDTDVLPALLAGLRDSEAKVRRAAANALGKLHMQSLLAVQGLGHCLHDRDAEVRHAVVKALGEHGELSAAVVTIIVNKALKDTSSEVRLEAAKVLGQLHLLGCLGMHAEMVTSVMMERQKDTDNRVQAAARAFFTCRKPSKESTGTKKEKGFSSVIGTPRGTTREARGTPRRTPRESPRDISRISPTHSGQSLRDTPRGKDKIGTPRDTPRDKDKLGTDDTPTIQQCAYAIPIS